MHMKSNLEIVKERFKDSFDVKFRGSKNQRIIDIRESINKGNISLIKKIIYSLIRGWLGLVLKIKLRAT